MTAPDTSSAKVRLLEVTDHHDGQRIDNFLVRTLKGVPRTLIYRILRKGEVRVNSGRIRPDYRLRAGDVVRIPPLRTSDAAPGRPSRALQARLDGAVLLEDREILVLNKPSGVAVHKGSGVEAGVIETLRALRPAGAFLELAHRLDRDTSGCLVLAKTPGALRAVQQALRGGDSDKRYLALVQGDWPGGEREVSLPLRKNVLRGGERMVRVGDDGKSAVSRFKPIERLPGASLMEVTIRTGRTHQIRVHAAHLGHPVAGDDKYGDAGFNRRLAALGLKRLFLHAHSLVLSLGGRELAVSAPLDADLKAVLARLEGGA